MRHVDTTPGGTIGSEDACRHTIDTGTRNQKQARAERMHREREKCFKVLDFIY
jgi:hypothetical protein